MPEHHGGFKFLEHMADAYIEAYGASLHEAFANSALAMFEVMTDTSKVEPKIEEIVEVEGHDLKSLLYSWLESLLLRFEIDNRLYSKFIVERINIEGGPLTLEARVYGEEFNPEKHPSKTEVKAVTFHLMEIEHPDGGWRLRFLLDL
ncbi:MAG: archease [Candidatus Bathyarchaeia archaeon]